MSRQAGPRILGQSLAPEALARGVLWECASALARHRRMHMTRLRIGLVLALCAVVGCGGGITQRTVSESVAGTDAAAGGMPSVGSGGAATAGMKATAGMGNGGMLAVGGAAPVVPACQNGPNATPLRVLSTWEYRQSVVALTGLAAYEVQANDPKPLGVFSYGMELNAQKAKQLLNEAERQGLAARDGKLLPCDVAKPVDAACATSFVDAFVGRAFRRPLSDAERSRYVSLFKWGSAGGDFAAGVELVVEAALLSPLFLSKLYLGDGTAPGTAQLTAFEVAARLSLLLSGGPPDAELAQAAANGDLLTDESVASSARRLLAAPSFAVVARHFHEQWLSLDDLDRVVSADLPQPTIDSLRTETRDFIDEVFRGERRLPDLLQSAVDPARPAGVLTLGSTLVRFDNPTRRGRFVRQRWLCGLVPEPPPQVPTNIEVGANQTRRQAWQQHVTDPVCAGCHQLMDPIGFGFENFDELGHYRETDHGQPVDASGDVVQTEEGNLPFAGMAELSALLSQSPSVGKCVTKTWLSYALQSLPDANDDCAVAALYRAFSAAQLDLDELLVALAVNPRFRSRDGYAVPDVPGPTFTAGPLEPLAARRKLLLDFAVAEARWLEAVVPRDDLQVVDQYLGSLRDLEIELSQSPAPAEAP